MLLAALRRCDNGKGLTIWDIYIARRPKCNLQSAQGPPVLQSASIRNPSHVTCKIASGVRTWNCVGP
eukprot:851353-Alexandrium_andersonii.AAC.1